LAIWKYSTGKIEYQHIASTREEIFYWVTILVSNTLGTALGDFTASSLGLGFERGAIVFSGLIAVVAILHFTTEIEGYVLFWAAYVLTRPLGATLGDTLTKSHQEGGLALGRIWSSLAILVAMLVLVALTSRTAYVRRGTDRTKTDVPA